MFSVVTIPSRGPEAEVETTVAGVRFDLGPGVGREGLSLRDPAAGLVDYSHWLTALRYIEGCLRGGERENVCMCVCMLIDERDGARYSTKLTRLQPPLLPEHFLFFLLSLSTLLLYPSSSISNHQMTTHPTMKCQQAYIYSQAFSQNAPGYESVLENGY